MATKPYRVIFELDTSGVIGQGYKITGSASTTEEYIEGIYQFNYGPDHKEIGDVNMMRGKDKIFPADRGRPKWQYAHNWMHCVLPAAIEANEQVEVPVMVGEDLIASPRPAAITLKIASEEPSDEVELALSSMKRPCQRCRAQVKY